MFQDKHESDLICQNARWIMDNSDLTNGNLIADVTGRSEISVTLTPLILILKIKFVTIAGKSMWTSETFVWGGKHSIMATCRWAFKCQLGLHH